MSKFKSINGTSKQLGVSASTLRRWLAEGKLPGYFSGSWFFCNVDELEAMISAGVFAQPQEVQR